MLMNWRESCLFALLIASGYLFKISCFKRSRREIYYLVYTVRTSKLLIALSMGESERGVVRMVLDCSGIGKESADLGPARFYLHC